MNFTHRLYKRLFRFVEIVPGRDPCWPWTGFRDPDGYGRLMVRNPDGQPKAYSAHHLSFALSRGLPYGGRVVRHRCHNRSCCRPSHLTAGSQRENVADQVAAGRKRYVPPKLSEAERVAMAERAAQGTPITSLAKAYRVSRQQVRKTIGKATAVA